MMIKYFTETVQASESYCKYCSETVSVFFGFLFRRNCNFKRNCSVRSCSIFSSSSFCFVCSFSINSKRVDAFGYSVRSFLYVCMYVYILIKKNVLLFFHSFCFIVHVYTPTSSRNSPNTWYRWHTLNNTSFQCRLNRFQSIVPLLMVVNHRHPSMKTNDVLFS